MGTGRRGPAPIAWPNVLDGAMSMRQLSHVLSRAVSPRRNASILTAMLKHPDLRECIETIRDILDEEQSGASRDDPQADRYLHLRPPRVAFRDIGLLEPFRGLLPPRSIPELPGYQFFAKPGAAYGLEGDYYDFIPMSTDRIAIVLADTNERGMSAAMMWVKFSSDLRHCLLTAQAPALAVEALNQLLCKAGTEAKFISLSLGLLDRSTNRLTLCSAGHTPILLRRAEGRIEEIGEEIAGFPLGIMPNFDYQQTEVELNPGDVVVVYSDALPDSRSPREELYNSRDNPR